MNAENFGRFRMVALSPEHIPFLEALEESADLPFWGADNYRRFLEEFPEYFGFCLIQEATSENPELCVTLPQQNAHLPMGGRGRSTLRPYIAFVSVASLDFGGCGGRQETDEKRLAGFSLARAAFDDLELLKIGVAPEFQRLGLGTRLMDETFAESGRRSCTRCFLEVRKSNQKAIQFYSINGFRIVGARLNYYSNPVEDAWVMERLI